MITDDNAALGADDRERRNEAMSLKIAELPKREHGHNSERGPAIVQA
jgi:hypothetical protein